MKTISLEQFRRLSTSDKKLAEGLPLRKVWDTEVKMVGGEEARQVQWRISTGCVDRYRDVVNPEGWALDNFEKNGPVLWSHQSDGLPVAKAVRTWVEDKALKSVSQFATKEEYAFADTVYRLVKGGYLKAVSVGFMPLEWTFNAERGDFAIDFIRQELLEYSVTPIPANPEALEEARALAGIDMEPLIAWAEKTLDETRGSGIWLPVPREKIEAARKAALGGRAPIIVDLGASAAPAVAEVDRAESGSPSPAPSTIAKKGRVLSKANETALRDATAALEAAVEKIRGVVAQVEEGMDEGDTDPNSGTAPEDQPCDKCSGKGKLSNGDTCDKCGGSGEMPAHPEGENSHSGSCTRHLDSDKNGDVKIDKNNEPDFIDLDDEVEESAEADLVEVEPEFFEKLQKRVVDTIRKEVIQPLTGRVE